MEALRVMELNHSQIEFPLSWPNQILRSLRIRCLDFCRLGTGLSSMLGHMTQLETLSLFQSTLADDQSPTEIAQLSNLKLLDLSVKSSLHPLPNGILSSLKKLEELYLGSRDHLQLGRDKEEEIGCLKEISAISNLAWLQIVLYGLNLLLLSLQEFDTQSLSRFNITVTNHGGAINLNRSYQFQKSFNLYLKGGGDEGLKQVFDPKVTSIVERTENLILNLSYSSRLRNLMPNLDENGFINLKKLDLYYGHCECLIDFIANLIAKHIFENLVSTELEYLKLKEICYGFLPPGCFNQLQEVTLYCISALECLWKGSVEPPSLCNLKSISVSGCHHITTLFSQLALKCLVKLQKIYVFDCENLKRIALREKSLAEEVLELPQLKVFALRRTSFIGFDSKYDKAVALSNQVNTKNTLKHFLSQYVNYIFKINVSSVIFVATMLISLEELKVRGCSEMCEVIGEEDEEVSQEDNAQHHDIGKRREIALGKTSKEFVFPRLSSLQLERLKNLRRFSGSHQEDYEFKFSLLTTLILVSCPKLKKFCSGKLDAPWLKKVQIGPIYIENFEAPVDLKLSKLQSLQRYKIEYSM
ncbi:uncharacterized protein [Coffea arabica]|uniref:Disease resistance protein At4g27190-like leucine-rich repeats domain-containing protein n=1 Tax=Coffea arabica TaxID=13443 RepID=A0ABM4X5J2_COFAR